MTKGKVLAIGSNRTRIDEEGGRTGPTVNYLNNTRGSRVCTKEIKNVESLTVRSPEGAQSMMPQSILEWYFVLRTYHQWTIFQAIRYALWLAR